MTARCPGHGAAARWPAALPDAVWLVPRRRRAWPRCRPTPRSSQQSKGEHSFPGRRWERGVVSGGRGQGRDDGGRGVAEYAQCKGCPCAHGLVGVFQGAQDQRRSGVVADAAGAEGSPCADLRQRVPQQPGDQRGVQCPRILHAQQRCDAGDAGLIEAHGCRPDLPGGRARRSARGYGQGRQQEQAVSPDSHSGGNAGAGRSAGGGEWRSHRWQSAWW
jgi:hypothetical protein